MKDNFWMKRKKCNLSSVPDYSSSLVEQISNISLLFKKAQPPSKKP